jgi:hypothetical protein
MGVIVIKSKKRGKVSFQLSANQFTEFIEFLDVVCLNSRNTRPLLDSYHSYAIRFAISNLIEVYQKYGGVIMEMLDKNTITMSYPQALGLVFVADCIVDDTVIKDFPTINTLKYLLHQKLA